MLWPYADASSRSCLIFLAALVRASGFSGPPSADFRFSNSDRTLYHFIRQAARFSKQADEMDKSGEYGQGLRDAFKERIGLYDSDLPLVLQLMVEIDDEFGLLDSQASAIISESHQQFESTGVLPPPPRRLSALQDRKKALIGALGSRLTGFPLNREP